MTDLEYIRNKISKKIKTINEKRNFMTNCKIMNIPFNSELTYEDEKELEHLRQIECLLEAWESLNSIFNIRAIMNFGIKPTIIIQSKDETSDIMAEDIDCKHYNNIKKALEVEENK